MKGVILEDTFVTLDHLSEVSQSLFLPYDAYVSS